MATLTGALTAGRTLLSMVAAPLAGTVSDWLGSRWRVAAWGLGIGIIGMALVAWGAPMAILAGIALGAVAGGSVQALVTALTGDVVSQAQRGRGLRAFSMTFREISCTSGGGFDMSHNDHPCHSRRS